MFSINSAPTDPELLKRLREAASSESRATEPTKVEPQPLPEQHEAPPGMIWQCSICGKGRRNLMDWTGGWDESCASNAILVDAP